MKAIYLGFQEFKHLEWQGSLFWLQNEKTILPLAKEAGKLQLKSIPAKLFTIPNKNNNQFGHQWSPHLKITFWYETMIKDITRRYLSESQGTDDHYRMAVLAFQVFCDREKEFLGILKSGFNAIIRDDTSVKNHMILSYDSVLECCTVYIPSNVSKFHSAMMSHLYFYFVINYDLLHHKKKTDDLLKKCHYREKDIVGKITETSVNLRVCEELEALLHTDNNILKRYLVKSFLCFIHNIDEKINQDMLHLKKRQSE